MTSSFELVISNAASDDLRGIHQFGAESWGENQADIYSGAIVESLLLLVDFPRRGKPAPNMPPGVCQLVVGRHLALYQVLGKQITVLRIVSPRTSPPYDLGI